jgi:DNA-binding transcriptional ArsR family regulator
MKSLKPETRDEAGQRRELLHFVEQFALILSEAGWPRMPARVFAYALAEDSDRYTASELAEGLGVSPAAISGAVRYLTQAGMLGKERAPGSRSDSYRLYDDDVWLAITNQRTPMLARWKEGLELGIEAIGPDGAGARRLKETIAFLDFMERELPALMERWHEERQLLFRP